MAKVRLGVDVGGTFTDVLLMNMDSGDTFRAKTPSTPSDQSVGIIKGILKACEKAGVDPSEITELMHGTTVATNAMLERKGARVGLIVTDGYAQVLQIARSFVPGGLAGWIVWNKPDPLADLQDTVEINERVGADGKVVRELDEASVKDAVKYLKKRGVESITVSLINAYANPDHEKRALEIIKKEWSDIPVSLSSEVLPEMREYERTLTTVANAYVRPILSKYLASLTSTLEENKIKSNTKVLRSDGGLMAFDLASEKPVNLMMSGPAGGVKGALWIAKQAGFTNLLTYDMGGTSTDVALIENGKPALRRETEVGDLNVRASSLDVRTVGAGGGSIAKVPELTKALRVGPESAGAEPGPVCYQKGGEEPTTTDANVVLGYLPEDLLGGEMKLDRAGAAKAIKEKIADPLGLSVEKAAAGIINIANENMFGALRLVSIEKGYDPRDFALIAFGGAGPLHANALGKLMGSWPVIIPPSPGVLCAYGDATTQTRNEAAKTEIKRFNQLKPEEVVKQLENLRDEAAELLEKEGIGADSRETLFQVDVRYSGQGFEVPIEIDLEQLKKEGFSAITDKFDKVHEQLFTFKLDLPHEMVNLRAVVEEKEQSFGAPELPQGSEDASEAVIKSSDNFWYEDKQYTAKIYDRLKLKAGNKIAGPAVVTEMDSTSVILPDHIGEIDKFGNILINPKK
ncbi:MAG: hydantoinase/oxoprolinase family protein [Cyclobacteriaceae bacterium]|nr:hydantoinase/oxoprolinase family protein [Cyclobacteriaceae bacterium]MCH8516278.1 hydantoinase/oxoprolinase family protein [Cyclobacteriaceae bacterium]